MAIDPNNLGGTATLTFNDDFNSLSLWNGQSGTWNTTDSWDNQRGYYLSGNGEKQWYINSQYAPTQNVDPWSVSNGHLNLTATPTPDSVKPLLDNQPYVSGQINTFHSFSQQYGYFEMSAKLPSGDGLWPAFWLLPENNSWPPELDVMEELGNNSKAYYTTVHSNETGSHTMNGSGIDTSDLTANFHRYGVDWEADKITWYLDGKQVFQSDTPADLHSPMYMIANLAVGGYWPGNPTSDSEFPATMQIDYIRAYSAKPGGATDTNSTAADPTHAATSPIETPPTSAPATDPVQTAAPTTGAAQTPAPDTSHVTDTTHTTDTSHATDTSHTASATPPATTTTDPAPQTAASDTSDSATGGGHIDGSSSAHTTSVSDAAAAPAAPPASTDVSHTPPAHTTTASDPVADPAPSAPVAATPSAPVADHVQTPPTAPTTAVSSASTSSDTSSPGADQFDFGALHHGGGHHGHSHGHSHSHSHGHAQAVTHAFDHFDWMHGGASPQSAAASDAAQTKCCAALASLQEHADAFAQAHGSQDAGAGWHAQHHHFGHHLF